MESMKNISWERLVNEGAVTYPCDGDDKPGNEVIFGEGFPTSNKKGKLVPAKLVSPDETPDHNFPLVLTTIVMLVLGIIFHSIFAVNTHTIKFLGISCK